jgi:DNA-binding phage protein
MNFGGGEMPRSAAYDDLLMEMLKDEGRALAYLNAALDERDPKIFLIALRNVRATRACRLWLRS